MSGWGLLWLLVGIGISGGIGWTVFAYLNDMDYEWPSLLAFLFYAMAFMSLVLLGVGWGESITCRNTATRLGVYSHWSWSTDCLVRVQDQWFPLDQVRMVNGRIEGA